MGTPDEISEATQALRSVFQHEEIWRTVETFRIERGQDRIPLHISVIHSDRSGYRIEVSDLDGFAESAGWHPASLSAAIARVRWQEFDR